MILVGALLQSLYRLLCPPLMWHLQGDGGHGAVPAEFEGEVVRVGIGASPRLFWALLGR